LSLNLNSNRIRIETRLFKLDAGPCVEGASRIGCGEGAKQAGVRAACCTAPVLQADRSVEKHPASGRSIHPVHCSICSDLIDSVAWSLLDPTADLTQVSHALISPLALRSARKEFAKQLASERPLP